MKYTARSIQDSEDHHRKALIHFQNLEATFSGAIEGVRNGAISIKEAFTSLSKLGKDIRGVGSYMSDHLDTKIYNGVKKEDSTIASQVLAIPELVELILSFSNVEDLLSMHQVDKTLNGIIDSSPRLQIALGLRPTDKLEGVGLCGRYYRSYYRNHYFSPFGMVSSRSVRVYAFSRLRIEFKNDGPLPTIGSRRLKMLIAQPPIKVMEYQRRCGSCPRTTEEESLYSDKAITMGDLFAKVKELLGTLSTCERCHDARARGVVIVNSEIEAKEVIFRAPRIQTDAGSEGSSM